MTNDGMTPVITVTDAPTAYLIAEALRTQADAAQRTANRLCAPEYDRLGNAVQRNISYLLGHARRLDKIADELVRQGVLAEADDYPTQTILMVPAL